MSNCQPLSPAMIKALQLLRAHRALYLSPHGDYRLTAYSRERGAFITTLRALDRRGLVTFIGDHTVMLREDSGG